MAEKDLIIGSHVNMSAPEFLLGSVKQAISYNENTFMFYTGAPQNTIRIPVEKLRKEEAHLLMKEHNINKDNVIVHAPYLINLANLDPEKYQFSVRLLLEEVNRVSSLGFRYLVLHPGAHLGNGFDSVKDNVIKGLNEVLLRTKGVTILIETMAGKGTEIGKTFQEVATIIKGIEDQSRIGVCLDTCHIHDGGYDLNNHLDLVLDEFDREIGLEKCYVIHINDSKNSCGAHKDRHENIGFGYLGFDTLLKVIYHPRLAHTIKILETPWINEKPPYKEEIEMIRNKSFDPNLKEKF